MAGGQSRCMVKWIGFAVSLPAFIVSGLATAFSVYAMAVKDTFQYTQLQVELIAWSGVAGVGFCFLQPIVTSRFGYQVTYITALIISPSSCMLVYIGTLYPDFFSKWPTFIGLFLCVANCGSTIFRLQICQIGVSNLDKKHTATIIGVYSAAHGFSKMCFCALYEIFFFGNLGGYFIAIAVIWFVIVSLCLVLHRPISQDDERTPILNPINKDADPESDESIAMTYTDDKRHNEGNRQSVDLSGEPPVKTDESRERTGLEVMLKSIYFHLMLWCSVVFYSAYFSFLSNLTSIWKSADVENPLVSVYFMSMVLGISRIIISIIYNIYQSDRLGSILLFSTYLSFVIAMITGMTCFNKVGVYVMTFLVGASSAGSSTLPWAMLSHHFGRHNLSTIMGGFYGFTTVVILLMQTFVGVSYDRKIWSNYSKSLYCLGAQCFYNSFLMLCSVMIVILIFQFVNFFMLHRKGRKVWVHGRRS